MSSIKELYEQIINPMYVPPKSDIRAEPIQPIPYHRVKSFNRSYIGGINGKVHKSENINFDQSHAAELGSSIPVQPDGMNIEDAINYIKLQNQKYAGTTMQHSIPGIPVGE
jgi:hypothetical protein